MRSSPDWGDELSASIEELTNRFPAGATQLVLASCRLFSPTTQGEPHTGGSDGDEQTDQGCTREDRWDGHVT